MFRILKIAFFTFAIVFLIYLMRDGFNSEDFQGLIDSADYWLLAISTLTVAGGIFLKGLRLQMLVRPFQIQKSFWEASKIQLVSICLAMATPGRIGEFIKIYLLAKEDRSKMPVCTLICIFERLMDFLVLSLMSLVLCLSLLHNQKIIILLSLFTLLLIVLIVVLFRLEAMITRIQLYFPKVTIFQDFIEHKAKLIPVLLPLGIYTILIWSLDGLFQWFILKSVGSDNLIFIVIGINSIVAIMSILTILPVGLGTMDVSSLFLYDVLLAVPKETIVFLLVASRIFGLATLVLMLVLTLMTDPELRALVTRTMKDKNKTAEQE